MHETLQIIHGYFDIALLLIFMYSSIMCFWFSDNETQLLAKLTDAIKQAISGRLTFTTPAVMSDVSKGDFIYQATFEYEKNKQWKGSVKKYKLNPNGSFGTVQWDAADKLNSKKASSRSIWTAGISSTGTNNFTTSNRDELKPLLFLVSHQQTLKLII